MDLAAWWRDRRWRALLDLIDQLPASSRLNEAVQNDPEQAQQIALAREFAAEGNDPTPWAPPLAQYDLHAVLLREAVHLLASLAGSKTPAYIPAPRTEVDRMTEKLARTHAISIGSRYGFSPEDF